MNIVRKIGQKRGIWDLFGTKSPLFPCFLQLVIELLRLGKGVFFRIIGVAAVDDGSFHILVEGMPVPEHDKFVVDAAFLATRDEGIAQLVGVMVGEQPLDGRADGIEVGLFRLFKVDIRHGLAQHGRDGDPARDDVVAHLFLARVAFQPVVVKDAQRLQFAPAHSRVEQDEQGARCRHFGMCGAIFDERLFFLIGEGVAFFTLITGKDDLLHRGIELIVVGGKVEDAAQKELQLLRGALFAFLHIAEEEVLHEFPVDVCKRLVGEGGCDIVFEQPLIFAEGGGLGRLLFEGKPVFGEPVEQHVVLRLGLCAARCGIVVERFNEFAFEDGQVLG